ncbi:hypothetical protein T440DRAFT_174352 [Plenodomus tracheiphilus IPT5]|uniref:Uncharacterized protein n=1 Tax=Plenodomus tracheiphilus IPT5 TaxID=1408161 RepID=A0A6A7B1D8_9PLEO|nr:hypothetical protein T440DRAFT_174352 [Plenodomus tracheiphilus IPT5]
MELSIEWGVELLRAYRLSGVVGRGTNACIMYVCAIFMSCLLCCRQSCSMPMPPYVVYTRSRQWPGDIVAHRGVPMAPTQTRLRGRQRRPSPATQNLTHFITTLILSILRTE